MKDQGGADVGARFMLLWILTLASTACGGQHAGAEPESGERPLFDRETLTGWEGSSTYFRVEEASIVGGSRQTAIPQNEFLCTRDEFADFVLRLRFRLDERVNSGVQIRSQRIPDSNEVIGYQADLGDGYWGALYDESRRNRVIARPDSALIPVILDRHGWNEYSIEARGRRVRLSINGHETVDYTEPDTSIEQHGRICLQIHSGPPGEVWFRDLILEPLSSVESAAATP